MNILPSHSLFQNIFDKYDSLSLSLSDSKVTNTTSGKELTFIFSSEPNESASTVQAKYVVTITNNYITKIEYKSYPFGNDTLSQHTITRFSDFNKKSH